jgi:hypothetical protein
MIYLHYEGTYEHHQSLSKLDLQSFFFETFNLKSLKTTYYYTGQCCSKVQTLVNKSTDMSMLLRCTSLHSSKLCYIAETLHESGATCNQFVCDGNCRRSGWRRGVCLGNVCKCMN